MTKQEILSNLCYYDKRNPDYDPENGEAKKDCACDSCFYGKTKMAIELIKYQEVLKEARNTILVFTGQTSKDTSANGRLLLEIENIINV